MKQTMTRLLEIRMESGAGDLFAMDSEIKSMDEWEEGASRLAVFGVKSAGDVIDSVLDSPFRVCSTAAGFGNTKEKDGLMRS